MISKIKTRLLLNSSTLFANRSLKNKSYVHVSEAVVKLNMLSISALSNSIHLSLFQMHISKSQQNVLNDII